MASAILVACRTVSSGEVDAKTAAKSRRTSGKPNTAAVAFATSDLPHPCTPHTINPRGSGSPNARAS
jgi:hypothetical protein